MAFPSNIYIRCILLVMLLCQNTVNSQETFERHIDSLLEVSKKKDTLFVAYEALANRISQAPEGKAQHIFDYALSKDSSAITKIFLYKGYGKYLSKIGQVDAALQYRKKGLQLATKEGLEETVLYYQITDSLISEKTRLNVANLEVKYETEKKDRQIAEQGLEIAKKQSQKQQLWISIGAITLLATLAGLFFVRRLRYQKTITSQKETLHKQKVIELEQKNKLLALNSMIAGQETERLRIAKDLHDSLGGLLSSVKAHFTTIQDEIKTLEKLNITHKTNALIDEACVEVRRISHNMIPHALTISGLVGALEDMAETLQLEDYTVDFNSSQFPEGVGKEKQAILYRLIQEIVSNIKKHANAKNILIQIFKVDNGIGLVVEDNGTGFNYEEAIQQEGVGLKSINSRVAFLEGTIDWSTSTGAGTTITINIPKL